MKTVLVTGASGFVGQALCGYLMGKGVHVKAVVRSLEKCPKGAEPILVPDIADFQDWSPILKGVDVVFHLAALAHQVHLGKANSAHTNSDVMVAHNVLPTKKLGQAAAQAGVHRFVYMSSIKVNGEHTDQIPFSEVGHPNPQDAYGDSKWKAEQEVSKLPIETVRIRSPLVYGEGVKGNFYALLRLCDTGWPLPFACICNQRSLIYLQNLVDALYVCATHEQAANKIFLVRDGDDTMTKDLVCEIRRLLNRESRLFSLPPRVLKNLFWLTGRLSAWNKLSESLRLDDRLIRDQLGWQPPFSPSQGLENTVQWFRAVKG